jgi:hypothetical protein
MVGAAAGMTIKIEYNTEPLEWGLALFAVYIFAIAVFVVIRRIVRGKWEHED